MKIDPNQAVNLRAIHVLCRGGAIHLPDGRSVPASALAAENAFAELCRSLDPNTSYIAAFLPDHGDADTFYRARDVAGANKVHMQATVERAEFQLERWNHYKSIYRGSTGRAAD